jgi:hypothetical protein
VNEIEYFAPAPVRRTWATRDVVLGAVALAMGMAACVLHAMSSPIENAIAAQLKADYVLASRATFWLATVPGGVLGVGGMFLSASLLARRAPTLGLAKLAAITSLAAVYMTALSLARTLR